YGTKSAATVARYSLMSARFLLTRDIKLLVIACNTASAFALDVLRAELQVPVLGVVEPGAEAAVAASASGHIGVIGTLGTVRSGAYARAIAARAPEAHVTALACPLFVPLVEEGWLGVGVAGSEVGPEVGPEVGSALDAGEDAPEIRAARAVAE